MSDPGNVRESITVIIPACNEADVIASTIRSAKLIPDVSEVIVVDDGSKDGTASAAGSAGATKVIRQKHRGKGTALNAGVAASTGEIILMLDADLGETARQSESLVHAVSNGEADVAVASFPSLGPGGGFGIAQRISRNAIQRLTGLEMTSPLSGQRAFRREVFEKIGGFAPRFAAETAMTIDAHRAGFKIAEIPLEMTHRRTGKTLRGFIHRGRQFWDIWWAVMKRSLIRKNFRGDYVPIAGHWLVLGMAAGVVAFWAVAGLSPDQRGYVGMLRSFFFHLICLPQAALLVLVGMWFAGFVDDVWGDRGEGGFLGHFRPLVCEKRVTTGLLKVVMGGITCLVAAAALYGFHVIPLPGKGWGLPYILLDASITALSANGLNLLDLRPGRASGVALVLGGLLLLLHPVMYVSYGGVSQAHAVLRPPALIAIWCGLAALVFWRYDSRGKVMLGDSGANALGGMVGLLFATAYWTTGKLTLLALLIAIHIYSEKRSISATIEGNRVLRWIDRRLGVR